MTFERPEWLLVLLILAVPGWPLVRRGLWGPLAVVSLVAAALALTRPSWRSPLGGKNLVAVVDRSRSMPGGADATTKEALEGLLKKAGGDDRLAVVEFGEQPFRSRALDTRGEFAGFSNAVDRDGSNLGSALESAAELLGDREGRVVVFSDGEIPLAAAKRGARRLAASGVSVDVWALTTRDAALDVAAGLSLPASVAVDEPFSFSGVVESTKAGRVSAVLRRGGQVVSRKVFEVTPGRTPLVFRDVVGAPGVARYELALETDGDSVLENNAAAGVVRVEGPARVLLMTAHPDGAFRKLLASQAVVAEVRRPGPLSLVDLDGVSTLILEDVDANAVGEAGLSAIERYVGEMGGSLLMTGGRHSFGEGGYFRSKLEPALPVSLELRKDERRASVAVEMVMDSSCSMSVPAADGRPKIQLAAEGILGASALLDERDDLGVMVVDTSPTHLVKMGPNTHANLRDVARAQAGGGGIFVGVALKAARDEILKSDKQTRHILLFSDAADSEQPEDYRQTIGQLRAKKVTISVIAMGTRGDSDARLLEEIASLGDGRIYFADDVSSLPRLFNQETLTIARSTFVDIPTAATVGPDVAMLGDVPSPAGVSFGGYNVTYLRPNASVALRSADEHVAPLVAFWPYGRGKTAVYAPEVDGEYAGAAARWAGRSAWLGGLLRFLKSAAVGAEGRAVVRTRLLGKEAVVTIDVPEGELLLNPPSVAWVGSDGVDVGAPTVARWAKDHYEATLALRKAGPVFPLVEIGAHVTRAPPVTLPYSPEVQIHDVARGTANLRELAALTGGAERMSAVGLWADVPASKNVVALQRWLVLLSALLLAASVVTRRWLGSAPLAFLRRKAPRTAVVTAAATEPARPTAPQPASAGSPAVGSTPSAPPAPPAPNPVEDALSVARRRSQERLKK